MMYKHKKYNFLVVALLFLISILAGVSAGMSRVQDVPALLEDELPPIVEVPNSEEPQNIFAPLGEDASAFERLEFGFNVMENGDGYMSYSSFQFDVLGHTQYIATKRYRSYNHDFTEEWYKMEGVMSSKGKNQFMSIYTDGNLMKIKRLENEQNYNFASKTYNPSTNDFRNTTNEEWLQKQLKVNSFFTTVNPNTSSVISYDNKGRGKDYYTVKVSIKPTKLDAKFMALFEVNGGVNVNINSIIVTFKIDKKTGYFKGYDVEGTFTAEYAGVGVNCIILSKETYLTMNASAESTMRPLIKASFGYDM